jgi:hypothetical protein
LLIPIVPGSKPINNSAIQQFNNLQTRPMSAARTSVLWCIVAALYLLAPASGQETPVAATPAPTRAAPVPLAEIATRSDDLAVYLKQVATRVAPDSSIASIAEQLTMLSDRVRVTRIHTVSSIAASPPLREVDDMLDQWRGHQTALSDWTAQLTSRATALEQELRGLDELCAICHLSSTERRRSGGGPRSHQEQPQRHPADPRRGRRGTRIAAHSPGSRAAAGQHLPRRNQRPHHVSQHSDWATAGARRPADLVD